MWNSRLGGLTGKNWYNGGTSTRAIRLAHSWLVATKKKPVTATSIEVV